MDLSSSGGGDVSGGGTLQAEARKSWQTGLVKVFGLTVGFGWVGLVKEIIQKRL
jgi:hypothetical protein